VESSFEVLESFSDSLSDDLGGSSSLESVCGDVFDSLLDGFGSGLGDLVVGDDDQSSSLERSWVEFFHDSWVVQWVDLSDSLGGSLFWSKDGLDFFRIDDSGQVRIEDDGSWELPSLLLLRSLGLGSKDVVELLESVLSPDDESSEMTSWSQLQDVQSLDGYKFNTGDVSESQVQWSLFVVDNQWSSSLSPSSVSEFSFTGSQSDRILDLLDIFVSSE